MNTQTHEKDSSPNLAQQLQQQQDRQQSAAQAQQGQAQDEAQAMQAQQATQKAQSAQQAAVGAELAGSKSGGSAQKKAAKSGKSKPKANAQTKKQADAQAKTNALNPGATVQTTPAQEEQTVNNYSKSRDEQHADAATSTKMRSSKAAQSAKNDKLQDEKNKKKEASDSSKKDEKGKKKEASDSSKKDEKGKKKEASDRSKKDGEKGKKKEASDDAEKNDARSAKAAPKAKTDLPKKSASAEAGKTKAPASRLSNDQKADAKRSKKGSEKKTAKSTAKSSDVSSGGGISISASASGGSGGGGGMALPKLGANAPAAPAPKGEGAGKNALESYATSGLSHQLEHHAELGAKTQEDLQNSENQRVERLPGEKDAEIHDGARDAENQTAVEASKSANAENQTVEFDGSLKTKLEAAASKISEKIRAKKVSGKGENIPNAPVVDADMSAIDSAQAEKSEKFASTKSEAAQKVRSLDKKLPTRGYDDLKLPKVDLEEQQTVLETSAMEKAAELEQFHEESKGLLDHTDDANSISSQLQEAAAQVDSAEQESDAQIDASVAEHEAEIEQIRADAKASEEEQIAAIEADMNSQIDAQSAEFETEAASYDAENQQSIASARSEIDQEKNSAQADISREKQKAEKDKKEAEENDQKEEKAWYEKLADKAKNAARKFVSRLKSVISGIIDNFLQTVNNLLDKFADLVSKVNKDLGDKLRKAFDKFKQLLDKFAKALVDTINKCLDMALEIFTTIVDQTTSAIHNAVEAFKAGIKQILETLREAYKNAVSLVRSVLDGLLNIAEIILRAACKLCGADPEPIIAAAQKILTDPGAFFSTLWSGIKEGFSNFRKNLPENLKAIAQNLFSMWLGGSGLQGLGELPTLQGFIKLGLSIIGINPDTVLKPLSTLYNAYKNSNKTGQSDAEEKNAKESQEKPEENSLESVINGIKTRGLTYIAELVKPALGGFGSEIIKEVCASVVPMLVSKGIAKLASMANPLGGIISAIKGVWDTIQFFRSQFNAIAALGSALKNVLISVANGDTAAAATAVEAALCQAIPVAIELLLRVIGINIAEKVKKVVSSLSTKIKTKLDAVLSKIHIGKLRMPTFDSAQKKKDKEKDKEKKDSENLSKKREEQASRGDKFAAMGNWGAKQSEKVSGWQSNSRLDLSGITDTINGKKEGTLGINIDNLKSVQAADKYHKERNDKKELAKLLANPEKSREEILKKQRALGTAKSYDEDAKLTDAEKRLLHITALQSAEAKRMTGEPLTKDEKRAVAREAVNKSQQKPTEIPPALKPASDSPIQNVKDSVVDIWQGAVGGAKAAAGAVKKDIADRRTQIAGIVDDVDYLRAGHSIRDLMTKKRLEKNKEAMNL